MSAARVRTAAVLGLVAAAGVLRRHRAVRRVDAGLRTAGLYAPLSIGNPVALAVVRRLYGAAGQVRDEVTVEQRTATAEGARPASVLTYRPPQHVRPSGALLWIHGGGFVMGAAQGDHPWCREVAAELGVVVVSVDYRLAPEAPFPAGLDDCLTALRWLHASAAELGVDPDRIAVGGASAGGGLAAALAQRATDEGVDVCFQLLVYPMLDDRTVLRRDHRGTGRFLWTPRSNRFAWTAYLGHPPHADEPRPYAAAARRADLAGLPPAWIGVGDLDLFHEEDVTYAGRLGDAGVPCGLTVVPGMYHAAEGAHGDTAAATRGFRRAAKDALARGVAG